MITTHTQLLNALIEKYNLKSYLEIGVQNPANNFDKIIVQHKIGIDPETPSIELRKMGGSEQIIQCTSDDYFLGNHPYGTNEIGIVLPKIDIAFIDGNHTKEQVKKDFENCLKCLAPNGFIVIHDVLPENEQGTKVPRSTKIWWGTVYQWAMDIQTYDGIGLKTFNIDNGCMLVWKDAAAKYKVQSLPNTYEIYKEFGHRLMNVTNEVII